MRCSANQPPLSHPPTTLLPSQKPATHISGNRIPKSPPSRPEFRSNFARRRQRRRCPPRPSCRCPPGCASGRPATPRPPPRSAAAERSACPAKRSEAEAKWLGRKVRVGNGWKNMDGTWLGKFERGTALIGINHKDNFGSTNLCGVPFEVVGPG